jgi:DNA-binding NtrC family response regulator
MIETPQATRILLIEDEPDVRFGIRRYFELAGMRVFEAGSCAEGVARAAEVSCDVVLLDHCLPDGTALDCLPRLKALDPDLPVIILTGNATIDLAVSAIKLGADHFLTKPVEMEALAILVRRAVELRRLRRGVNAEAARGFEKNDPFVYGGRAILALEAETRRALASDSPVFITGETGSGKSMLARWLHRKGPRAAHPFVDLNCAGLNRELLESELFGHQRGAFTGAQQDKSGLLELGDRGTVFLDEIGDMDSAVQAKLLKVIEEKRFLRLGGVREIRVDVRVITATHRDLSCLVGEGRFRQDLYYRLNALPLQVPALRKRLEDLPLIAERMLAVIAGELSCSRPVLDEKALDRLKKHAWPGNFRELRHVLERAVLLVEGERIHTHHLRFDQEQEHETANSAAETRSTLQGVETRHIMRTIEATGGNLEAAARQLGISRSTLYQKIQKYKLKIPGRHNSGEAKK